MNVLRFFSSGTYHKNATKSALAALRIKTGYTFANCRKALELNNNDAAKAEEWLKEQAKALGWNAVSKVQNRKASHGLIGIAFENKKVAMVEINCETDFVSKNEKFREMVELVTTTCLKYPILTSEADTTKFFLNGEELGKLKVGNEFLKDHMALLIGKMGENMVLKRAFCFETMREDVDVAVSVHPPSNTSSILYGKYGSFISYQKEPNSSFDEALSDIGNELCKHIIGMNPTKIGDYENDEPCSNPDDEKTLIYQEFISDDSKTVGEFLKETGVKILDFQRFECGESETQSEEEASKKVNDTK